MIDHEQIKDTRFCKSCNLDKDTAEFTNKYAAKNRCDNCHLGYYRKRYRSKKQQFIDLNRNKKKLNSKIVDLLKTGNPCVDCGNEFPVFCMDFDHVYSNKDGAISALARSTISLSRILIEITKCDLVCALCHRDRTYKRQQLNIKPSNKFTSYDRNRKIIQDAKSKPCANCGLQFNHWQMEFDHLSNKTIAVGRMLGMSVKRIQKEIDKCQILCIICHRIKNKILWDSKSKNG